MRVTVHCCGPAARLAGAETLHPQLPEGSTVHDLFALLGGDAPDFAALLATCACARGDAIVARGTVLAEGDELALLPPVAGG